MPSYMHRIGRPYKCFFSRCLHLHSRVQQKFHLTSRLPQVRKWLNYTMRHSDQIMCINLVLYSITFNYIHVYKYIYIYISCISMCIHLFKFVCMCIYIYNIYIYIYVNVDMHHICMYARIKQMMMP